MFLIHGMSNTRIYQSWSSMKKRCLNTNDPAYKDYGGRGIKVCEEWLDFEKFYQDMKNGYDDRLMLDRIDNDGGYCPKNCRWATRTKQNNNTRRNRYLTYEGKTQTLSQWAREIGVKRSTLAQRFYVYKWDLQKCLTL